MKTAIVLFNLGGPDGPESVKPFRINLFSDRAIIRAPVFIRLPLTRYIAARSAKAAEENYAFMGGKSPLLEFTTQQANALEAALGGEAKVFIAMRYWHPFAAEAAKAVKAYDPDRILLLPLYPHFSTTTTGSSLTDWHEAASAAGLIKPTSGSARICGFDIQAQPLEARRRRHRGLLRDAAGDVREVYRGACRGLAGVLSGVTRLERDPGLDIQCVIIARLVVRAVKPVVDHVLNRELHVALWPE